MCIKTWQAGIISAGIVAAAILLAHGDRDAAAQVGAAPDARWHVAVVERAGFEQPERIVRDAVLVDGATGETWIMVKSNGVPEAWVPLPRKAQR